MSYFKYIEQRKKGVSDYIDTVEDYTVLTETEQVVYDHFKREVVVPFTSILGISGTDTRNLDWILKKRVYSELTDLVNEGTGKFCRYYDDFSEYLDGGIKNNISPYYYKPIFLVGYQNTMFPLYKEEFGDCENTIELHRESSFDITQLESDFFDELYNYSGWEVGEYKALKETFKEDEYKYLAFCKDREQVVIKIVR